MKISLKNIGKRYNNQWIFRGVDPVFEKGNAYAILGGNGSGKSTLLQLISGNTAATEGKIEYELNGILLEEENIFRYLSLSAPYLELLEEFTLTEMINFHFQFKGLLGNIKLQQVAALLGLDQAENKQIRQFSSGMKQRVKLGLAILSDTQILLLDEPATNLDAKAIEWYNDLIRKYSADRIVVVCSNQQKNEYEFCKHLLNMEDYKGLPVK